jgi:hypothetical protein
MLFEHIVVIVGTSAARRITDVVSFIRVLIVVDWSMFVVDGLLSVLNLGVVRFVVGQVGGAKHGMLMEVLHLHVMFIVESVIQLRVITLMLAIVARTVRQ